MQHVMGFILAAGFGTRLKPLTDTIPKPLLQVGGHRLIDYARKQIQDAHIEKYIVNAHYLSEQIVKAFEHCSCIVLSIESTILGTGGGLKKQEALLKGCDVVCVNGDIISGQALEPVIAQHQACGALGTLVLREVGTSDEAASIGVDTKTGRILEILGHRYGPADVPCTYYMFTGVQIFDASLLSYLPLANNMSCIIRQGYIPALLQGEKLNAYISNAYWADVGTFQRLEHVEQDAASGLYANVFNFSDAALRC